MRNLKLHLFLPLLLITGIISAQHFQVKKETIVFKKVDGHSLIMEVYQPILKSNLNIPAIVFFFGGGWVSGDPSHFQLQAEYLASRGIKVFCADYRTKNRHQTTPFESVKDAKSAMRFLKENGNNLGIDTFRIIAAGGSSGGHLAACTALIDDVNESTDNLSISSKPAALILFNPVVDTGKYGYGQNKLDGREFELSPVHHIKKDVPPVLIFHGMEDKTVPYENVVRFKHAMDQEGNKCTLIGYRNQDHGFFNYIKNPGYFKKTLLRTEVYLDNMNLLRGKSWLNQYVKEIKNKDH